jgi:hypothetical protein
MITLKATDFSAAGTLATFPDYVSNGHWMIAKSQVENAAMFATADMIKLFAPKLAGPGVLRISETNNGAEQILKCIPDDDRAVVWTVQPWIHVSVNPDRFRKLGRNGRPVAKITESYVLTCGAAVTYVAREYLDRFGIEPGMVLHSAHADGTGTLCNPDRTFVVMPVRVDTTEDIAAGTDAIAPFRSLVHLQDLRADAPAADRLTGYRNPANAPAAAA